MSLLSYREFFQTATGNEPYAYQCRLACGPAANPNELTSLDKGADCQSQLIQIPTGLGKTAAVVLAWLWNRVLQPDAHGRDKWPRRLVYCLPMRTLVEQTRREVRTWILRLARKHTKPGDGSALRWLALHSPILLMGGESRGNWDLYPERDAILIGTQDMLLSRALNRGYGMSRYRWPMHFGLLNNDALWVMDETQLMGVAVETSAQMDGFRSAAVKCPTWWMSATLDKVQLETIDHSEPGYGWPLINLEAADRETASLQVRERARKILRRSSSALLADKKDELAAYATALAEEIVAVHRQGTLTLVVVNRVGRAQAIFRALERRAPQQKKALIHSRFRPVDRAPQQAILFTSGDRIVVATQAIEAGVDVSARTLFTELAPWCSLVQRFGRTNRSGEITEGSDVFWIELASGDEKLAAPYLPEELKIARDVLTRLSEVGPATVAEQAIEPVRPVRPVLRRKDLLDLFDSTPDLAGNDLDISRYIRDGEPSDVQVFWSELEQNADPNGQTDSPARNELCAVSLFEFARFLDAERKRAKEKQHASRVWTWNLLDGKWQPAHRAFPGRIYLIAIQAGGYSSQYGWTGDLQHQPRALPSSCVREPSYDEDRRTKIGFWLSLSAHTSDVLAAVADLAVALQIDDPTRRVLQTAAFWHDVGKSHEVFQQMLRKLPTCPESTTYWAKSDQFGGKPDRPHFRHELASALAWLQSADATLFDELEQSLIAYVIASHHGKVRVSLRAFPNEKAPPENDRPFARGIWHGDSLPLSDGAPIVIEGRELPRIEGLDLRCMLLGETEGRPSWLSRVLSLRNRTEIGPFRLAWLEAIFRAADARASSEAERRGNSSANAVLSGS